MSAETFQTPRPVCPHCGHEFTHDDMASADADLYSIAPDEGYAEVECPSCCETFHVRGGYVPHYTTATDEDEL